MIARGDYQNCHEVFFIGFWDMRSIQGAKRFYIHRAFHFFQFQCTPRHSRAPRSPSIPFKSQDFAQNRRFFQILPDFRASALGHARTTCPSLKWDWKVDAFCFMKLKFTFKTRWSKLIWNKFNASKWEIRFRANLIRILWVFSSLNVVRARAVAIKFQFEPFSWVFEICAWFKVRSAFNFTKLFISINANTPWAMGARLGAHKHPSKIEILLKI